MITISSRTWVRESNRVFQTPRYSGARFATWAEAKEACRLGAAGHPNHEHGDYHPCWCWDGDAPDPEAWADNDPTQARLA